MRDRINTSAQRLMRDRWLDTLRITANMASSSSVPPKKRQKSSTERLVALHHGSYVSQNALTFVLKDIKENGLPDALSRRSQYRAYEKSNASRETPYGVVVRPFDVPQ